MIVCFTADWHIKLGQKNVPKEWQINRYIKLVEEIEKLDYDVLCIAGDIFDKLPTLEEIELYFKIISMFSRTTIIFDGNHEAGKRHYTWLNKLKDVTNAINTNVHIVTDTTDYIPDVDIIPYTSLKTFNSNNYTNKILFTHVRGSIPPYVIPEIELSKFSRWKLILAGDLHDHSATIEEENSKYNIVYPGSPLSITFHRNYIVNGVILCDTNTLEWDFIKLKLPQLIRKTIENPKQAVKDEYDHIIYEVKGNLSDMSNVSTGNLIDRKIINSNKESKLLLDGLTIEEELIMYLTEILNISKYNEIVGVFNEHT